MGEETPNKPIEIDPTKFYCIAIATFDDGLEVADCSQTYRGTYGGCDLGQSILDHGGGDDACFIADGWFGVGMLAAAIIVECRGPYANGGDCDGDCPWGPI